MSITEWIERTKYHPTDQEWEIISLVYTFHPLISDVNGKKEIAKLFKQGGIGLLRDMTLGASTIKRRHDHIQQKNIEIELAEQEVKKAKDLLEAKQARASEIKFNLMKELEMLEEETAIYKKGVSK
jgi:hypothetical protein